MRVRYSVSLSIFDTVRLLDFIYIPCIAFQFLIDKWCYSHSNLLISIYFLWGGGGVGDGGGGGGKSLYRILAYC